MEHPDLCPQRLHLLARGSVTRIYGPPGTGKTTRLAKQVASTALARGRESMLITSFTTTAARAIADAAREQAGDNPAAMIPDRHIGTLHSFGWRAIGHPEVALDPKIIKEWNGGVAPKWRITPDGRRSTPDMAAETGLMGGDGTAEDGPTGDALLSMLDMRRAAFSPRGEWPAELVEFEKHWTGWKSENSLVDFTDMIMVALERAIDGDPAPGKPQIVIGDEAQDLTPAESALLFAWGRNAERLVLALDDDQAINAWRGGDAAPILHLGRGIDGGPQDDIDVTDTVLEQSWRIPGSVHAAAQRWIERVAERAPKVYRPRDEVGHLYSSPLSISNPRLVREIECDINAGLSVMVIASCGYMLLPLLKTLRSEGIPFGNGFRPAETRWNPLRKPPRGIGTPERLFRYLVLDTELGDAGRPWTGEDIRAWWPMLSAKSSGAVRGAGKRVDVLPSGEVPYDMVCDLFADDEHLERAVQPDLDWLLSVALKSYADKLTYPATVARRRGALAHVDEPRVTVGTIHSVKGGGADVVYLAPDLSAAGHKQWRSGGAARDEVTRLMYVGLTRTKQRCVLLAPGGAGYSVPRPLLVPSELEVPYVAA